MDAMEWRGGHQGHGLGVEEDGSVLNKRGEVFVVDPKNSTRHQISLLHVNNRGVFKAKTPLGYRNRDDAVLRRMVGLEETPRISGFDAKEEAYTFDITMDVVEGGLLAMARHLGSPRVFSNPPINLGDPSEDRRHRQWQAVFLLPGVCTSGKHLTAPYWNDIGGLGVMGLCGLQKQKSVVEDLPEEEPTEEVEEEPTEEEMLQRSSLLRRSSFPDGFPCFVEEPTERWEGEEEEISSGCVEEETWQDEGHAFEIAYHQDDDTDTDSDDEFPCMAGVLRGVYRRRIASDGHAYTKREFRRIYGEEEGDQRYDEAEIPNAPCVEYRPVVPLDSPTLAGSASSSPTTLCYPRCQMLKHYQKVQGCTLEQAEARWHAARGSAFYHPLPLRAIRRASRLDELLHCREIPVRGAHRKKSLPSRISDFCDYHENKFRYTFPPWRSRLVANDTMHLYQKMVTVHCQLRYGGEGSLDRFQAHKIQNLLPDGSFKHKAGKNVHSFVKRGLKVNLCSPGPEGWNLMAWGCLHHHQALEAFQKTVAEVNKLECSGGKVDILPGSFRVSFISYWTQCPNMIQLAPLRLFLLRSYQEGLPATSDFAAAPLLHEKQNYIRCQLRRQCTVYIYETGTIKVELKGEKRRQSPHEAPFTSVPMREAPFDVAEMLKTAERLNGGSIPSTHCLFVLHPTTEHVYFFFPGMNSKNLDDDAARVKAGVASFVARGFVAYSMPIDDEAALRGEKDNETLFYELVYEYPLTLSRYYRGRPEEEGETLEDEDEAFEKARWGLHALWPSIHHHMGRPRRCPHCSTACDTRE